MKDNLAAYKMTIWSLVFPAIIHSTMERLWSLVHSLTMTARGGAAPEAGVAAQGGGEADQPVFLQLEGGEGGDVGEGGGGWRGGRRPGRGCGGRPSSSGRLVRGLPPASSTSRFLRLPRVEGQAGQLVGGHGELHQPHPVRCGATL